MKQDLFQLDPEVAFLNHGSFGACPREVFDAFQAYQRELEKQPVLFLQRDYADKMDRARARLAEFLHANKDDLVFVPNATFAANVAAVNVPLQPGDEVLTNNLEYGATTRMWKQVCRQRGAELRVLELPHRPESHEQLVSLITGAIKENTKVVFMSHLTSTTAMQLPVREVIAACRELQVLCIIDGAHAPGQIDLNLDNLDADFYFGNCHKWMMAPKSAAFLHVRQELHDMVEPLSVSWATQSHSPTRFVQEMDYSGTFNVASYLAVGDAIEFMARHGWDEVRSSCTRLRDSAEAAVCERTGLASLYPEEELRCPQMVAMELPAGFDLAVLKRRLYDEHRVEIPLKELDGKNYLRASLQGYNVSKDVTRLMESLDALLPGA